MIAQLSFRFGNRAGIEAEALREIKLAQERLTNDPSMEFWFMHVAIEIQVTAGQASVNVEFAVDPSQDFVREVEGHPLLIRSSEGTLDKIERVNYEDGLRQFGEASGTPLAYSFYGRQYTFFPTPDVLTSFELFYAFKPLALSVEEPTILENEFTVNAYSLLMNKAGIAMAQAYRDKDGLANFTADYNAAFAEIMRQIVQYEESNFDQTR